ncbi:MAG TPA: shikimate kinase [Oscillospiraceae bacterium]|nr:shikimate kinase [Oscillospiraceae bacterium]
MKTGLVGKTLGHSFSPLLHKWMWGCDYALWPMDEDAARAFFAARDFDGVNVTIPYKRLALSLCDEVDPRAVRIGAVNTVVNRNGRLFGCNTDYGGMKFCIARAGISLAGRKVLVFGSGGTSHTACAVAQDAGAREIVVVSRAGENNYENLSRHEDAEILLNTTPVGMYPDTERCVADPSRFPRLSGVVDVVYNPLTTLLVARARTLGIPATGGLPMLAAQAKYAAELFTGQSLPDELTEQCLSRLSRMQRNLILIGMPGCGKTTVGKMLAARLERPFVDLDAEIERSAGRRIPDIFAGAGENAFRDLETEALRRVGKEHGAVVACGGGAVLRPENRFLMRQNGKLYYLLRDTEKLASDGRPLSRSPEAVKRLFEARRGIYEAISDARIDCNGAPETAADEIAKEWEA